MNPRAIFEQLLSDCVKLIVDYKFYCTFGEPRFAPVVSGRAGGNQHRSFVDVNTREPMPLRRRGVQKSSAAVKPDRLDEIIEICIKLSKDIPLIHVDFCEDAGRIYVGEMTFNPGLFLRYEPIEWDRKLGDYIDITKVDPENIQWRT